MKRKLLSLLLTGILSLSLVLPATAAEDEPSIVPYATNAKTVYTDGGTNGRITISFRATCVLVSYSTKYSWTSSMTPESGKWMDSYYQKGTITFSDYKTYNFSTSNSSYSTSGDKPMHGGYSQMNAYSIAFGNASQRMTAIL